MVTFNLTFLWKESSVALAHDTGRCRMYTMQQQTLSQCKSEFSIHSPIHPFLLLTPPPPTPALHLPSARCGRWSLLGSSDICRIKQWLPCAGPQSEPEACCYCVWFLHMQISGHGARQLTVHTPTPQCKHLQVPKLMTALRFWHSEWLVCRNNTLGSIYFSSLFIFVPFVQNYNHIS